MQPDSGDLSIVSEQAVPPPPGQRQGRQGSSRSAMKIKGEKDAAQKKVHIKVTNTPIPWSVGPSGGSDPSVAKQEGSTMVEATSQVKCNKNDCVRCVSTFQINYCFFSPFQVSISIHQIRIGKVYLYKPS